MPGSEGHSDQNGKLKVRDLCRQCLGRLMSLILTFFVTYSDTNVINSEILHPDPSGSVAQIRYIARVDIAVSSYPMPLPLLFRRLFLLHRVSFPLAPRVAPRCRLRPVPGS